MVNHTDRTRVWDLPVRLGHWLMVIGFVIAYVTSESERWRMIHVISGTLVLATVSFRVMWGFVGSQHARFASFVTAPRTAWRYLSNLRRDEHEAHIGHNPAGGWSVLALLAACMACTLSGLAIYNEWQGWPGEEWHEAFANGTVALIGVHLMGVLISSAINRENLVLAMWTGYKPWRSNGSNQTRIHWMAALILIAWIGVLIYFTTALS